MDGTPGPPTAAAVSLLELPDKCLLLLMQLLAQQSKRALGALARTNSKLLALALPVAVADVSKTLDTKQQLKRLYRHLQHQGHLARRLHLQGRPSEINVSSHGSHGVCGLGAPHIKALPDAVQPHLEALTISCLRVAPSKFVTPSLAHLQELDLSDCLVTDDTLEAALLAVAPSLRSLTIQRLFEHRGLMQLYSVPFPNAALPALTALTSLQLTGSVRSTAGLSGLVELRDLVLQSDGGIDVAAGDLPASDKLTRLVLHNVVGEGRQYCPSMDPAALSRVPVLRHLVLSTYMQPEGQPEGSTAGLLQALGSLTQLTLLQLREGPLEQPLASGPAAAAYASLTASSALQTLEIAEAHLPDGAWGHIFGHGRQLPQLRSLRLHKSPWYDHAWYPISEAVYKAGAMTAADLAALAPCCPGLTSLVLEGVQQQGVALAPLLSRLTDLQALEASGASDADASVMVQQLLGLRQLLLPGSSLSGEGVQGLTRLTRLAQLRAELPAAQPEAQEGKKTRAMRDVRVFVNKAPAGSPPDVWSQLAEDCERRKDPAAYKVWKEAEDKARSERWQREMFGRRGGSQGEEEAAPAGEGGEEGGEGEEDEDSSEGGGTPGCLQQ